MAFFLALAAVVLLLAAGSFAARWYYLRVKREKMQEQIDEAREALEEMRALVLQPGWARISKIAFAQIEARKNEVLLQPTTDTYAQEYMKGEIQGIQLFVNLPRKLVEENKDLLAVARKLEEEGA